MAKKSKLGTLHLNDFTRGLLIAVIAPVLIFIEQMITEQNINTVNWEAMGLSAFASGLAYILKNLGTNSDGKILKAETPKQIS